ncbi:MAG: hypothetical protein LAT65_00005 [Saccharospirillum sp.]|nr:hypothetical protein [Saccharospirillum sp.]
MGATTATLYKDLDTFWCKEYLFNDTLHGHQYTLDEVASSVCPNLNETAKSIIKQFNTIEVFNKPIVAVCGLMNSGKSTLTASFLDKTSRPRVNIGDVSAAGTHRFVLWAPYSWRQYRHQLFGRLEGIFSTVPELLSENPDLAAAQYNARSEHLDKLNIPLVAFDKELDSIGFAILDCPDIQRSYTINTEPSNGRTSELRALMLEKASHLCSAFIVVASLEQQESKDLKDIFSRISSISVSLPIYYILSKSNSNIDESLLEANSALSTIGVLKSISAVFVSPRIHSANTRGYIDEIEYINTKNEYSITETLSSLDKTELYERFKEDTKTKLIDVFNDISICIDNHIRSNREVADYGRGEILKALNNKLVSESGQRIAINPHLLAQLQDSMLRTGPFYARIFRYPHSALEHLKSKFSKVNLESKIDHITTQSIVDFLDGKKGINLSKEDLTLSIEKALTIYNNYLKSEESYEVNRADLDDITTAMWKERLSKRKIIKEKAPLLVTSSLMLIGTLSILFFPAIAIGGKAVFMAASMPEIFAVLGISAFSSLASTKALQSFVSENIGSQQVSDLFACLQDSLGIPRSFDTGELDLVIIPKDGLPVSNLPFVDFENRSILNEPIVTPKINFEDSFIDKIR